MRNSTIKHKRGPLGACPTKITVNYKTVVACLKQAQEAKKAHKESNQCDGEGCTACHYWSGVISAYSALIGNPGIID